MFSVDRASVKESENPGGWMTVRVAQQCECTECPELYS